jgi:PAS domain S-box-containing protein
MLLSPHLSMKEVDDFYNTAPCGYLSYLESGLIVRINTTLLNWLGYQRHEVVNCMYFQDLLSIGGKIYYETHYAPLLAMQEVVQEINFDLVKKDKTKLPVLVNAKLINKEKPSAQLVNVTIFDITQRKAYEKELLIAKQKAEESNLKLQQANAELEKFAYVVSHDLKAPLNNIIQLIDLLKSDYELVLEEEGNNLLNMVGQSADRLKQLINGILYYSKNIRQQKHIAEEFSLKNMFEGLEVLLNPKKQHQISYPMTDVLIRTNKVVLEQILINLFSNAIKYNDKPQVVIAMTFREDDNFYYFTVKDNGIGISEQDQIKLFNLFAILDKIDRNGEIGTGVGLFTIKKLIENLGGQISLQSVLGEGTTFSFSIQK